MPRPTPSTGQSTGPSTGTGGRTREHSAQTALPDSECSCTMCGATMQLRFIAPRDHLKPDEDQSYEVYWCRSCDWGQIWPRPTREQRASFYAVEQYYTHSEQTNWPDQPKSWLDKLRIHLSWRLDRGELLDPGSILGHLTTDSPRLCEIGCGDGAHMAMLRDAGFDVVGIEPDEAARRVTLERGLTAYPGEAEILPPEVANKQFDVVLMSHVLEHTIDVGAALASVSSILRPGGLFIVEVPNCGCLGFEESAEVWPWTDAPRHLSFFTPDSLDRTVTHAGFEVLQRHYSGFCRMFSNEWIAAERKIWSAMYELGGSRPEARMGPHSGPGAKAPNFKARSWKMLLRMLLADKESKYDSIRLVTRIPATD